MAYTFEQFKVAYASALPPKVPENVNALLSAMMPLEMRKQGLSLRPVWKNPLPSGVTFQHLAVGLKLLLAQGWFVDAMRMYVLDPDGDIEEFYGWPSHQARSLLVWYGLESGLDWVREDGRLATQTFSTLSSACFTGACNIIRGEPLDYVFEHYVLKAAKQFNIKEICND